MSFANIIKKITLNLKFCATEAFSALHFARLSVGFYDFVVMMDSRVLCCYAFLTYLINQCALIMASCFCTHSCSGGVCPSWAEAASGRLST